MAEIDDFVATLSDAPAAARTNALPTPADITANLAPVTSATTKRIFDTATPSLGQQTVPRALSDEERLKTENAREGVPFYTRTSQMPGPDFADMPDVPNVPMGTTSPIFRYQMARRHGLDQQLNYAKQKLGDENARLSKDGRDIIVSIPNPSEPGKQMDVTVNDRDITLGDFTALAAHAPEFAGAILGLAAVRTGKLEGVKGFLGYVKDIFGGAVGQEVAGGLAEAETRWEDQQIVNPGQLTMERGKNVLADTAMGLFLGGLGKAGDEIFQFAQAPFSASKTELQALGSAAKERLSTATGRQLDYTAGQASGSAPVIMGEAYLGSTPAGQRVLRPQMEKQSADLLAVFDALTSGSGTDEEIGRALIKRLQGARDVREMGLEAAKTRLETGAQSRIKGALTSGQPELTPVQAGDKLRSEIMAEHGTVMKKKRELYTEAYEVPGATDPIVPTAGITEAIKDIKLPMRTASKEVKDFDAYGNPIARTVKTKEPVSEFLHPEVEQFLSTKLDPKMPIQEVVQMRDMLYDEIARGEAVKGIPTKQLNEIGRSLTKAIEKGIDDLPAGSELKNKLGAANKFYKEKVLKFEEAGIADIFKEAADPGFKEAHQIIQRLTTDPGKYQRTIKLLGPNSEGAKTIRAFVKDDLLRKSASNIDPTRMEAKKFIENLRKMRDESPDIFNDVIGARGTDLLEDATTMGVAQGDILMADAEKALSGKTMRLNALQEMKQRAKEVNEAEGNQLLKAFTKGKLDFNTVNPEKAVQGLLNAGTKKDIEQFMDALRHDNPAMAMRVERKMTEKFLEDVGGSGATDVTIQKFMESNKELLEKYKAVLGPRQYGLLMDVKDYLGPIRYAKEAGAGTGMLVKGSKIGQFVKQIFSFTNPTKEIYDIVTTRTLSLFVTNPAFRKWVENTPREMFPDLAKMVVVSEPFISALQEDIKDKSKLADVVVDIRKTFQGVMSKPAAAPPPPVTTEADFLNTLKP